jgi:phage host-nuclease inhibitor protein Gam
LVSKLNVPDKVFPVKTNFIALWIRQEKNSDPKTELNEKEWFIKAIFRIFGKGGGAEFIIHPFQQKI